MPVRRLVCLAMVLWAAPAAAQPRVDALGDPLPPGAVARLGTLRLRHLPAEDRWGDIEAIAISPDGKRLASLGGLSSPESHLWDVADGKHLATLPQGHSSRCKAAGFSPQGDLLAASAWGKVHLWDGRTGKAIATLEGADSPIEALAFADAGRTLVVTDESGTVTLWDLVKRARTWTWQPLGDPASNGTGANSFLSAGLSPDGTVLVGALGITTRVGKNLTVESADVTVAWDVATGKELWRVTGAESASGVFAFAADGKRIAFRTSGDAVGISVRDTLTGKAVGRSPLPKVTDRGNHLALALAPDGKTVIAAPRGCEFFLLDPTGKAVPRECKLQGVARAERWPYPAVAFAPDGKSVAVALYNDLHILQTDTGKPLIRLDRWHGGIRQIAFSPDGHSLDISTQEDGRSWTHEVKTWTIARGTVVGRSTFPATKKGFDPYCVSDNHQLAVVKTGDSFSIADPSTGKIVAALAQDVGWVDYQQAVFSPGRRWLVAPTFRQDRPVLVFEVKTGKTAYHLPADAWQHGPAFSADEQWLAWYDPFGQVTVVAAADGKERCRLGKVRNVAFPLSPGATLAFSPDGTQLAGWDPTARELVVWDLMRARELRRYPGEPGDARLVSLAWSPNGRMLAVAIERADHNIQVWETLTGKVRRTLTGHRGRVEALAWSPDGRLLASGSADTTVLVWDVYGTMP
jgi:WD40 repeat protein